MAGFDDPVNEKRIRTQIQLKLTEEDIKAFNNGEPITYEPRMPLECPRKPVGEFLGGESYHPTSMDIKRISEACKPIKRHKPKLEQIRDNLKEKYPDAFRT